MSNVIVLSQNFNIDFLSLIAKKFFGGESAIVVSPNYLFESEKNKVEQIFKEIHFYTFADFLTDEQMAEIDKAAYTKKTASLVKYIEIIREKKNTAIVANLKKLIDDAKFKGYLLSRNNDLGIVDQIWIKAGFQKIRGNYYYDASKMNFKQHISEIFPFLHLYGILKRKILKTPVITENEFHIYKANGKKYILIGKLSRIDYRLTVFFDRNEQEYKKYLANIFYEKVKAVYLVPWHEYPKCKIPDSDKYDVRYVQDGYLPSNYSDFTYYFKPMNVTYCVWDKLGALLFKNQNLPYSLLPFRKKLYLPLPKYPDKVKKILVATSASGDWTAQKNRSDDDLLVKTFIAVAKALPDVQVIYRCHPNWVCPDMLGVNSINRVITEFEALKLNNLKVSSNIPGNGSSKTHTFSRSSLEQDLENVDIVFGEHSVSMIDAGFKNILFCPVNVTKRRCFAQSLVDLGFPLCTSANEIITFIDNVSTESLKEKYKKAIDNYNAMTDEENI